MDKTNFLAHRIEKTDRVVEGGAAIDMAVWEMPAEHFGSFVDGIPAPLS